MENKLIIVRGGGDLATGVISTLYKSGFSVLVLEVAKPSAIRRSVAFSEAMYEGNSCIEGMCCQKVKSLEQAYKIISEGKIAILEDPEGKTIKEAKPIAVVDAILAKENLGTSKDMADCVIALGPGFEAGVDAHFVIETMRGHNLGRIYEKGSAIPNTGTPGLIAGHAEDRVLHAQAAGILNNCARIGDVVQKGQVIAEIQDQTGKKTEVKATFTGLLRGLIRDGYPVTVGFKIADIDPRVQEKENCFTISDKARALGGAVLTALMMNGVQKNHGLS